MATRTRQSSITFPAKKPILSVCRKKLNDSRVKDEEYQSTLVKTPKRNKEIPNVTQLTPSSAFATLSIDSPTSSDGQRALHSFSEELPCRENELRQVREFLLSCIRDQASGSMYISGLPGTGKTSALLHLMEEDEISENCQMVMANCTTSKSSIYKQIVSSLRLKYSGRTDKAAVSAIEKVLKFTTSNKHQKMILLVLDEIDELSCKNQTVLYKIFEWPSIENSRLILIGIANSVDLTDRVLPRVRSLDIQPKLLHFQPYTKQQIVTILKHRLSQTNDASLFAPGALELLSAKVAGQSGDLRKALDLGRRVLEKSKTRSEIRKSLFSTDETKNPESESGVKPATTPRKRTFSQSISTSGTSEDVPKKTPKKTISNGNMEKENDGLRRSPRKFPASPARLERTPCKLLTSSNIQTPSPVRHITPRKELVFSGLTPRKNLFDDPSPVGKSPAKCPPVPASPRRSPRKNGCTQLAGSIRAPDVLNVVSQMYTSARNIHSEDSALPLHQKLVMCTLLLMITKGKDRVVTVGKLLEVYSRVCARRGITAADQSAFISICREVEMSGGLQMGKGPARMAKVTLEWDEAEVAHALQDKSLLAAVMADTQVLSKRK